MEESSTSLPENVTLIIRAPNQHVADHTIQCGINWSIRNLKDYLSEVYPSKPKREDQKLIYSGQLLADNIVLKDVLRTYEGQENHTVHLVCKTVLTKEKRNKTETKKDRVTTPNVPPLVENRPYIHSTNNLPSAPYFTPQNMSNLPDMRYFWPATTAMPNNTGDTHQQLAMMHQAYNQYISQYMQAMGYLPVSQQMNARDTSQMPNFFTNPNIQLPRNEINDNVAQPQQIQNNHRARNVRDDPDDDENRDWLDWFYTLSRVLVLFSIVYFYSSPIRFLFVSTLALLMYLYHIGFYMQMGLGLNNNNNNNNNNVNFNNNNNVNNVNRIARDDRQQRNEDEFNNNAGNDENSSSSNSSSSSSPATTVAAASAIRQDDRSRNSVATRDEVQIEQEQAGSSQQQSSDQQAAAAGAPERRSVVSLVWLILRSFFLSIIPDHQNVI